MLDRLKRIGIEARDETGRVTALPASSQEAAALVRLAADEGWCVAPEWMELASGAGPVLRVSSERICEITEVASADLMAGAGAGVSVSRLAERAAADNLCWPPGELLEPGALIGDVFAGLPGSWTLKGSLARRYLLTVEAVLADGSVLRAGARTVKSVTGYDLRQLFVGSRGTLGVITGLTLRLEAAANLDLVMERYRSDFSGLDVEADDGAGFSGASRASLGGASSEVGDGAYIILRKLKSELDPEGVFPSVDEAFASQQEP